MDKPKGDSMATEFERTIASIAPGQSTLGDAVDRLVSAAWEVRGAVDGIREVEIVLPPRLDRAIREAWKSAAALLTEAAMLDERESGVLDFGAGSAAVSPLRQAGYFYSLVLTHGMLVDRRGSDESSEGGVG